MKRAIVQSRHYRGVPAKRMHGLSLIELMIALVLGLVVVAAVFNVYSGTARSARFSDGLQTLQENGRHGMSVLRGGLRLAGYSGMGTLQPLNIANADATTVIVNTMATSDCAGGSTDSTGGVARNVYRFDAERKAVTCAAVGTDEADALELIDNVDAFGVLYGLDDDGNGAPERFVPWQAGLDVESVAALRVGLLINSGRPIRARARARKYAMLNTVEEPPSDRLARHVFQSTIQVRNRP